MTHLRTTLRSGQQKNRALTFSTNKVVIFISDVRRPALAATQWVPVTLASGGTVTTLIQLFQRLRMREATRTFLQMPEGMKLNSARGHFCLLFYFTSPARLAGKLKSN